MTATNPTTASAWLWIAGTFCVVLAATMLPTVGWVFAAPALLLVMGATAVWWVRSAPGVSATQAAVSGAIAGLAAGVMNLVLAAVGGLFVGLWMRHAGTHMPAHSVRR